MPKMQQNTLGGLDTLEHSPDPLAAIKGFLLLRGGRRGRGRGEKEASPCAYLPDPPLFTTILLVILQLVACIK